MKATILPDNFLRCMTPEARKPLGKAGMTATERDAASEMKRERDLHRLILNELTRRDIPFYHARMDRKSTVAVGLPDFAFAAKGVPIAVEVKMPGRGLEPDQAAMIEKMRINGWRCFVVYEFNDFLNVVNWTR